MITTYFYMYPMEKISEIFPNVGDGTKPVSYQTCNIRGSWAPEMMAYTDKIFKVKKFIMKEQALLSDNAEWVIDVQLGKILLVEDQIKNGFHFLDYDEGKYEIAIRPSRHTIGTIVNFPYTGYTPSIHPVLRNFQEQRRIGRMKSG